MNESVGVFSGFFLRLAELFGWLWLMHDILGRAWCLSVLCVDG